MTPATPAHKQKRAAARLAPKARKALWSATSQTLILIGTAIVFHGILWARNAACLWSRRRGVILAVVLAAEAWQLVTDPIGAIWGAWRINPDQVLGIWLYGVGITPIDNLLGIALVSSAAACAVCVLLAIARAAGI